MRSPRLVWSLLGTTLVLCLLLLAWFAGPLLAPELVLRWSPCADPVVRALVRRHGDGFTAYAMDLNAEAPPPTNPHLWARQLEDLRGDPEPTLIRAATDPRPGRAYFALVLLAEWRYRAIAEAAQQGQRPHHRFRPASDAALLAAASPGNPAGTRRLALVALAGQDVAAAIPLTMDCLSDPDPELRILAAHLLRSWGDAWDLTPWDRSGRGVRAEPPRGRFGAPSAIDGLRRCLASETDPTVRAHLDFALAGLADGSP